MADDVKMIMRYRVEASAPLQYQKPILLMQGDKRANVLEVSLFDGEKTVDLSGLSVGGSVTRADGAEVDIDGTIAGNVITCVLNGYAYAVAGPFKAAVKLLDALGDVKRTVLLLAGTVEESGSGPQIDTGKEMPSLEDILAQLETMKSATRDANAAAENASAAAEAASGAQQEAANATTAAGNAAATATTAAGNANTAADRANQAAADVENGTAPNAERLGGVGAASYALKTDSAPDSAKLGGKAPEYYIQQRNLLYNSDFRNPVNQRGFKKWTPESGTDTAEINYNFSAGYTIDRWQKESASVVSVKDGYITVDNTAGSGVEVFCQTVDADTAAKLVGKTITLAICLADDTVYANSGVVDYDVGVGIISKSSFALVLQFFTASESYQVARLIVPAGKSVSVKWIALYEGSYTAETLPQPRWLHPRLEMIRMGYPVQPVNLLDNSDFRNPINQRGDEIYTSAANSYMYTIDRWGIDGVGVEVSVIDGGIKISNPMSDNRAYYTKFKKGYIVTGKTYTGVSALTDGTVFCGSGIAKASGTVNLTSNAYDVYFQIQKASTTDQVKLVVKAEKTVEIAYCAMYEGSYTVETLPPYVPKENELFECMYRFFRWKANHNVSSWAAVGTALSATQARFLINAPCPMDDSAVATIAYGDMKILGLNTAGNTNHEITGISCYSLSNNAVYINVNTSGLTVGQMCVLQAKSADGYIDFSRDL